MVNYFELLGVETRINIDSSDLRRKYYKLSREFHPDFANDLESESADMVTKKYELINVGYEILNDQWKRIHHFLEVNGILDNPEYEKLPQEFLLEMMEINEALFDLQLENDETKKKEVLSKIDIIKNNLENGFIEITSSFENQGNKNEDLIKIKDYYLKSKYLLRIQENLSIFASDFRGIED